jgi:hypothetical protein
MLVYRNTVRFLLSVLSRTCFGTTNLETHWIHKKIRIKMVGITSNVVKHPSVLLHLMWWSARLSCYIWCDEAPVCLVTSDVMKRPSVLLHLMWWRTRLSPFIWCIDAHVCLPLMCWNTSLSFYIWCVGHVCLLSSDVFMHTSVYLWCAEAQVCLFISDV